MDKKVKQGSWVISDICSIVAIMAVIALLLVVSYIILG